VSDPRARRVGFVANESSSGYGARFTATFSAHWEDEEARTHGDGPSEVDLDEAIAWAREHAHRVWIQVGDRHYVLDPAEVDEEADTFLLPAAGLTVRDRPWGTPEDGRVQRRYWGQRGWIEPADDPAHGAALAAHLSAQPGFRRVTVTVVPGDPANRVDQGEVYWQSGPVGPAFEIAVEVFGGDMRRALMEFTWALEEAVRACVPGGRTAGSGGHGSLPDITESEVGQP
jgi:hypothetical protein